MKYKYQFAKRLLTKTNKIAVAHASNVDLFPWIFARLAKKRRHNKSNIDNISRTVFFLNTGENIYKEYMEKFIFLCINISILI
jgi:hypothetical protein